MDVLSNPVYGGRFRAGAGRREGCHEGIVSAELFHKAREASWLKLKAEEGTYALNREALRWGSRGHDVAPFSVDFPWPKKVPAAVYRVTVYECRGGSVERYAAHSFPVVKVGLPAWLSSLATDHALWYGVASVLAAVIVGFGTDLLATLIFRRKRPRRR